MDLQHAAMMAQAGFTKDEITALANMLAPQQTPYAGLVGKWCIVRCTGAGVHAGVVQAMTEKSVTLEPGSFRLWQWQVKGKTTGALHGVAKFGLDTAQSKVEKAPGVVYLMDPCEVIEMAPGVTIAESW